MLKGIYSAAAGMVSQMVLNDINADNLANLNTPGYKSLSANFKTFGEAMINRIDADSKRSLGEISQGSQVSSSMFDFRQGDLVSSGNPLDLALQGQGFFMVKDNNSGEMMYTRAGNFTRDNDGFITAEDGARVQGTQGDIQIPRGVRVIQVTPAGEVTADNVVIDRLKIAQFEHPQMLHRAGSNMFATPEEPKTDLEPVAIRQGAVERSNANAITEMVNTISGMRVYESLQKSINMQNQTFSKAINEVGRVG